MTLEALAGTRFTAATTAKPLSKALASHLTRPESRVAFDIDLETDRGDLRRLSAQRIIFSSALGPAKGGVRFVSDAREDILVALAFRIMLKCAVNGLPHGGAGGAVAVSPATVSKAEKERVARAYVASLMPTLADGRDILSPDMGTDAETMAWMADEYSQRTGETPAGAINGKPVSLGGIPGRPGATARGAWIVLEAVLADLGWAPDGLTFAVQGFGSAGGHLAVELQRRGLRMVAASDTSGGWIAREGASLDADLFWREKAGGRSLAVIAPDGARRVGPADVLRACADIVIPAATAQQITADVAAASACRLVLEIANGPTAPDAEPLLAERGVIVVPDLVANAGGITMSHFEWAQNRARASWSEMEARERLEASMRNVAQRLLDASRAARLPLAIAAQHLAIERLEAALRG